MSLNDRDEPSSLSRRLDVLDVMAALALLVFLVVLVFALTGCTAGEIDSLNPPKVELKCTATNPYLCLDGHSCCNSVYPECKGPDAEGYYCEPKYDPDDPGNVLFGAKQHPRERATHRIDE